jgi:hypothetical protein
VRKESFVPKRIRFDIDIDSGSDEINEHVATHIGATIMGTLHLLSIIAPDVLTSIDYDPYIRNEEATNNE